jgi:hypothetical protein
MSANTQVKRNMKERPLYSCLDWSSKARTQCWSGLRKYIAVPYLLSPDYYPSVQKLLNQARNFPLSYIFRVLASHSLLSALDDANALYTVCIWYGKYFNIGHNEILLTEVYLSVRINPQ